MTDTTIKLRRSAVKGKQPSTSQLELGELAINTVDGKVYLKQKDSDGIGGAESIVEIGGGGGTLQPSGTPVDNQIAVWTSGTELEGDANLTWDATTFNVTGITTLDSTTVDGRLTANGGINGLTLANGGITGNNFNIEGVNVLSINDPGEGIVFQGNTSGDITLAVLDDTSDNILQVTGGANTTFQVPNLNATGVTTLDSTTIDGPLIIKNGITYRQPSDLLYVGGNGLDGTDAAIYLGNNGEGGGYGWRFFYEGSGSGNANKLIIRSENFGSSVDALSFTQDGNATFASNITVNGITTLDSTTIDGNLSVSGNLTVSGTRTEINVDALNISDALIILGDSNTNTDVVDIGFYGKYYNSTAGVGKTERAGLFRDAGDGNFYLFTGLRDSATDAATVINRAGTNYTDATLVAGNLTLSGLSTQASETTALMIDGSNIVGTRDLGTGAFTAAYSLPLSADGTRGGVQIGYVENGKNYPVELSSEKMYVNVPWTDTVYTHPDHTGDVTSTGDGATVIADDAVTYAKIQNVVNDERILGRVSGANGIIEELTKSDVLTMLNVADGAEVNVATDLSYTASTRVLASSTGTDATLPEVVAAGNSGLMTGADKTKLDGIATGAEVNVATNITITENATTVTVASSTGSNDNIAGATASLAGVVTNTTQTFGGDKTFSNDVNVTGTLTATAKSFDIPHPSKERMRLRYGSLEGPENGVYVRGQLNGTMEIVLPDYWMQLVDPNSITVNLTSIGPDPVWVEHIQDNVVTIGGSGKCFYHIYAERVDIEKLEVEYRV